MSHQKKQLKSWALVAIVGHKIQEIDHWMGRWMGGWMFGWMGGSKSRLKDFLQKSFKSSPGWMDGWVDGCIEGSKSQFKDCLWQLRRKSGKIIKIKIILEQFWTVLF